MAFRGALGVLGVLLGRRRRFRPKRRRPAPDGRQERGHRLSLRYPPDLDQQPRHCGRRPVTTREILLHGKGLGNATLVVWSKTGERTFYNVTVDLNLDSLRKILKETFPNEPIVPESSRESLTLNGTRVEQRGRRPGGGAGRTFAKTVVNNMELGNPPIEKQVLLRVRFAELDRTKAEQYGVNWFSRRVRPDFTLRPSSPASARPPPEGRRRLRTSDYRVGAEHLRLRSQAEPGGVSFKRCRSENILADPGGAESGDHQRQGSLLPGGRRVSGAGTAGRRQRGSGDGPIQRIRHSLALHSGGYRKRDHQAALDAGGIDDRCGQWRDLQRLCDSRALRRGAPNPTWNWAKARVSQYLDCSTTAIPRASASCRF